MTFNAMCARVQGVGLAMSLAASLTFAQTHVGYDLTKSDVAFFEQLKSAVVEDEREWVASRVSFPILVRIGAERREVVDEGDFLSNYDVIMNCRVRTAISKQVSEELFKNWRGVMVGDGELWFTAVVRSESQPDSLEFVIIALNN